MQQRRGAQATLLIRYQQGPGLGSYVGRGVLGREEEREAVGVGVALVNGGGAG